MMKDMELIVLNNRPHTQYVDRNINITEHRAPTDGSVKLLREMEAAAEKNRISSLQLAGNIFHGHVERYYTPQDYRQRLLAVFDLNDKRCTVVVSVHADASREEMVKKLIEQTSNEIAQTILAPMIVQMMATDRFWK